MNELVAWQLFCASRGLPSRANVGKPSAIARGDCLECKFLHTAPRLEEVVPDLRMLLKEHPKLFAAPFGQSEPFVRRAYQWHAFMLHVAGELRRAEHGPMPAVGRRKIGAPV